MRYRSHLWLAALLLTCSAALAEEVAKPQPLTVKQAISIALRNNPAVREAGARVEIANATTDRIRAEERVQMGLDSRYVYLSEVPTVAAAVPGFPPVVLGSNGTWIGALAAQQLLYSGGRVQALVQQAADSARATAALGERTRQQVAYGAERACYLVLAAERERQVAQDSLAAAEEHYRVAQARYEERAAAQYDVLRAQVQVEESRQQLVSAESDIAVAQAAMAQALGAQEGTYTVADGGIIPSASPPALEPALAQAKLQRPELTAANLQIAAAGEGETAARAERRPTLSLLADYQVASPESPFQFTRWSATAAIRLPILDGGRIGAKIREAIGTCHQATAARDELCDTVAQEVRTTHARLLSAITQVEVARKRVELADQALDISNVRYAAGVATTTEVMDSEAALTRARQGLTRALTEQAIADAGLRLAMGAIVTAPEAYEEVAR